MRKSGFGWVASATFRSVLALGICVQVVGCWGSLESKEDDASAPPETCEADVRSDEWNIDCSAACNHVIACKQSTGDSDLAELSCGDCLGSCVAGVALGGNDLAEGTEEDRRSWECAQLVEGCSALDHNCDLF